MVSDEGYVDIETQLCLEVLWVIALSLEISFILKSYLMLIFNTSLLV